MKIGCPKEIKPQEFRVGMTPGAVHEDPSYGVGTTEYMRSQGANGQGGYGITLECGQHQDPTAPEMA